MCFKKRKTEQPKQYKNKKTHTLKRKEHKKEKDKQTNKYE